MRSVDAQRKKRRRLPVGILQFTTLHVLITLNIRNRGLEIGNHEPPKTPGDRAFPHHDDAAHGRSGCRVFPLAVWRDISSRSLSL